MSDPLKDYTFVFTGNMSIDREDAKSKVVLLGGRSTTAISGKTTHLVIGDEPGPSKLKKAKDLKIKILKENEFLEMIKKAESKFDTKIDINIPEDDLKNSVEINSINNLNKITDDSSLISDFIFSSENEELNDNIPWSEKYRPKELNELVGNPGAISMLEDFITSNLEDSPKDNKSNKAALLSGAPGIGKTTAVQILCKKYGINRIEFNASDVRNKKAVKEELRNITSKSLKLKNSYKNRLIVMDEVDGMTSDRGGLAELNRIIKTTNIPIICICNDRQHLQMQTLANNCLDIKFRKIDGRAILPRLKEILLKEKKHLPDTVLNEIIIQCNSDMRYIINTLQKNKDLKDIKEINVVKKDVNKNIFEISAELFRKSTISKKIDLYFEEYSILLLFIQENYCKVSMYGGSNSLKDIAKSAESISMGDVIDQKIHGAQQDYSLMPYHAFYSCANATNNLKGGRVDFPSWLGQNSKAQKIQRNLLQIKNHLKLKFNLNDIRNYVINLIFNNFISKLSKNDVKGAIDILINTELLKEDVIFIGEVLGDESFKKIPTKIKSQLTRDLKKIKRALPYNLDEAEVSEE